MTMNVGTIWEDIGDAASSAAKPFTKAVSDVFDAIPGSDWVKGVVNGPLRDFANSAVGKVVLRAMATSMTGGLAATLGPQLASTAWALPGLVRGESFDEAWWKEFSWRAEKTAQTLGSEAAGKAMGDMLKAASDKLMDEARKAFPTLPIEDALRRFVDQTGLTPEALARQLGIRPDVAAAALNLVLREMRYPLGNYGIATGDPSLAMPAVAPPPIKSFGTNQPRPVYDYSNLVRPLTNCPAWDQARAAGQSPVILNALANKCNQTLLGVASNAQRSTPLSSYVSSMLGRPDTPSPETFYASPPPYEEFIMAQTPSPTYAQADPVPETVKPAGAFPAKTVMLLGTGLMFLALFVDFGKLTHRR